MRDMHVLVYHLLNRHLPGLQILGHPILALQGYEWELVLRCTKARDRKFAIWKLTVPKDHSQKIVDELRRSRNLLNALRGQVCRMLLVDCVSALAKLNGNLWRSMNGCSRKIIGGHKRKSGSICNSSAAWNSGERESNTAITPHKLCVNCTNK